MIKIEICDVFVSFSKEVLDLFKGYIQLGVEDVESGGVLVGYVIDRYSLYVTNASRPTGYDRGSRFSFFRSKYSASEFVSLNYKESGCRKIYLGEWHSHPESFPTPSQTDIESFCHQILSNRLNSELFIMVIVGNEGLFFLLCDKESEYGRLSISYKELGTRLVYFNS
jgi:integrative and conjugative element protein (TIGR02256 family)